MDFQDRLQQFRQLMHHWFIRYNPMYPFVKLIASMSSVQKGGVLPALGWDRLASELLPKRWRRERSISNSKFS